MKIVGKFKKIIFKSQNTPFMITLFKVKDDSSFNNQQISIQGSFPEINLVFKYELIIEKMKPHFKYGESFKLVKLKKLEADSKSGLIKYFSSKKFNGIGVIKAKKIVDSLGKNAIEKIVNDYTILLSIDIKEKTAKEMHDVLVDANETNKLFTFFTLNELPLQLFNVVSTNLETERFFEIIKENPYQLFLDIKTISFEQVDYLAKKIGFENQSFREEGYLMSLIFEITNHTGGTMIEISALFNAWSLDSYLNIDEFNKIISKAEKRKLIKVHKEINMIQDFLVFSNECYIANRLLKLNKKKKRRYKFNGSLTNDWIDKTQLSAIKFAINNNLLIITGPPGSGKTTIISEIITQLMDHKKDIILLAPTGKAAKQIGKKTFFKTSTIHKFLKWDKEVNKFKINELNPETKKILIIDEFSMVDNYVFSQLLYGLPFLEKIIFIGDKDQLPSIRSGQLLQDLIESKAMKTITLDTIYRQKEGSNIINDARRVIANLLPKLNTKDSKGYPINQNFALDKIVELFLTKVKDKKTLIETQILSPMYKGKCGIDNLNHVIQTKISNNKQLIFETKTKKFFVGDKVIQVANNYEDNVFNGDIGIISSFETNSKKEMKIKIDFDGHEVVYPKLRFMNEVQLSYAISVHKAQGSEFNVVFLTIFNQHSILLNRKLLYTALTRAKKELHVFLEPNAIKKAIKTDLKLRPTLLKKSLIDA